MSRSGYNYDDFDWHTIMWRGRVASATRGKRGQKLLKDMLFALDGMQKRELISDQLVDPATGSACAIGAALQARGIEDAWRLHKRNDEIAEELDVAECLIQEIEYKNDEAGRRGETPSQRWHRMRNWVESQIKKDASK